MSEQEMADLVHLEARYRELEQQWRLLEARLTPLKRELEQVEALTEEVKWELIRRKERIFAERGDQHDCSTA
ncbi:MAG: hypothetical protein H0Z34_03565 [Brevibacillus sp.]|nr:hypothetical protein [Brevibacillus sp.]